MEELYHRFFNALPIHLVHNDEDLHLLTPEELYLVERTERWSMATAAFVEVITSLCIFIPIYAFPEFFETSELRLGGPFLQEPLDFMWVRDLWMLVLTLAGLYVLLLVNLAAVHGIAVATGYIKRETKAVHASHLIHLALEKSLVDQRRFGIDPFEGWHPWLTYAYLLFNRAQGLIASALLRAALVNLFGREILRVYLDFSGLPIYMAFNMYSTRVILRNARVTIMGQTSIEIIAHQLPDLELTAWEQDLVYDTLQFVSVNKRNFHPNHYCLTHTYIDHFRIPVKPAHPLPADFFQKLLQARPEVADICQLAIVLGFILDGHVSRRERSQIEQLRSLGFLEVSYADIQRDCRNFVNGQGLSDVTQRLYHLKPVASCGFRPTSQAALADSTAR